MALFTIADEVNHRIGDPGCPECWEAYPEPCRCGGLMHAASAGAEDADGNILLVTMCDRCGRSAEDDVV